jgi:hypothetical protein
MDRDAVVRRALAASVIFNLVGAMAFAFPSAILGRVMGLPAAVPGIYSAMVALFVLLFGGAYAWLALADEIDRPMVALGAIGKACAFATFVAFGLLGELPLRGVLAGSGDLILAAIFAWWLAGPETSPVALQVRQRRA